MLCRSVGGSRSPHSLVAINRCGGGPSFFFNDPATTEIYTLSLHDALPTFADRLEQKLNTRHARVGDGRLQDARAGSHRSEEHTSELQSRLHLVCRLLLEKKKRGAGPPRNTPPCCRRTPVRGALGVMHLARH